MACELGLKNCPCENSNNEGDESVTPNKGDRVKVGFEGRYKGAGNVAGDHFLTTDDNLLYMVPATADLTVVKKAEPIPPVPDLADVVKVPFGNLYERDWFTGQWHKGGVGAGEGKAPWEEIAGGVREEDIVRFVRDPVKGHANLEKAEFFPVTRYSDATSDIIRVVRKDRAVAIGSAVFGRHQARRLALRILAEVGW